MSSCNFIIAQILGIMALFILCFSYIVKSKKAFLLLGVLGEIVYGLSFIFLNSLGTGLITLLSCMQNLVAYLFEKKNKSMPISFGFIFAISFIVIGILNSNSFMDILPIIIYIWFTFSLYAGEISKLRVLYFIPNFILTFYDISVKAYANAFEDGLEATFLAVMIVIDYVSSHQQKIEENVSATLNKIRLKFLRIMKVSFTSQSTVNNFKLSDNCNNREFIFNLCPKIFKLRTYPIPPF